MSHGNPYDNQKMVDPETAKSIKDRFAEFMGSASSVSATPTVAEVVERIRELVHAITQGRESLLREFTMRVPAEPKRDADLVLSVAADLLEREHKARVDAERKLNLANGTIANLMDNGCAYCLTSHEGTSYCTLAEKTVEAETQKREQVERELAELRGRIAESPRATIGGGGRMAIIYPGYAGQHVAIVPLREGE